MSDTSGSFNNKNIQMCFEHISELSKTLNYTLENIPDSEKSQKMTAIYEKISNFKHSLIDLQMLENDEFMFVYRELLINNNPQISSQIGKYLMFFLKLNNNITEKLKQQKIHIFISKIIETAVYNNINITETINFFKLLRQWAKFSPENFPLICLISLKLTAESSLISLKKVRKLAVEIIQLLAVYNFELFNLLNCSSILLKSLISKDIDDNKMAESIVSTFLLNILDEESSRTAIANKGGLDMIFKTFFQFSSLTPEIRGKVINEKEHFDVMEKALLASDFLKKCFQTPTGLMFFIENKDLIKTMLELLRQRFVEKEIKRIILRLVDDILTFSTNSEALNCLQTLKIRLFIECDLSLILYEISQVDEFEDRAKEIIQTFKKLCSQFVPLAEQPSSNFLCYSVLDGYETPIVQNESNDLLIMLKEIEQEFKNHENQLFRKNFDQTGVVVSKINSIFDNNFQENFYSNFAVQEIRKNAFLFKIEDLYLNIQNSFRDTRICKGYIWSNLIQKGNNIATPDFTDVFDFLSEKCQVWDIDKINNLLDHILEDKNYINDKLNRPFFKRFLNIFLSEDFVNMSWNSENFKLLKVIYKFFEVVLTHSDQSVMILKVNVAENPFKPYESFMKKIKSLFAQSRNLLKGSIIALPKNCTFQRSADDQIQFLDCESRLSYLISDQSFMHGSQIIRQKSVDFNEFDVFQVTLVREYMAIIAFFTFFPRGVALLNEFKIFDSIKTLIKKSSKYNHIISTFLLSSNHDALEVQYLMFDCLSNNSEYMSKLVINILEFLIMAEHYEIVLKFIDNLLAILTNCTLEIKKMIVSVFKKLLLESTHDLLILERIPTPFILSNPDLIDVIMKKDEAVKFLTENGIMRKIYQNFILTCGPAKLFEIYKQECTIHGRSSELQIAETHEFNYPFFSIHSKNFIYESGFFLSSLLKFPWGIRVIQTQNGNKVKLMLYCLATFNPIDFCIDVVGRLSEDLQNKFFPVEQSSRDWKISASLFISNTLINENLELSSEENIYRESKIGCDHICLLDNQFIGKHNGIEYLFKKDPSPNTHLILKQISVKVFLKKKKEKCQIKKNQTFLELICQTSHGAEIVKSEQTIDTFFETFEKDDDIEMQKSSLYFLGLIGKTEEGAKILMSYLPKMQKILTNWFQQTPFLSLRADIYIMANMMTKSATGQLILKSCGWSIDLLSKKMLPYVENSYVATYKEIIKRRITNCEKGLSKQISAINDFTLGILKKNQKSQILSLMESMYTTGRNKTKKYFSSLEEAIELFYFCVSYLSLPVEFYNSNRVYIWSVLDEICRFDQFLNHLNNKNDADQDAFLSII